MALWVTTLHVAFILQRDTVLFGLRKSFKAFRNAFWQLHSPGTLLAAAFLAMLSVAVMLMALMFSSMLDGSQPLLILCFFLAAQVPIFQMSTKLFSVFMFADAHKMKFATPGSSTKQRKTWLASPRAAASGTLSKIKLLRELYKQKFGMAKGKYFIEAMAARELVEVAVQMSGFFIAVQCQGKAMAVTYIVAIGVSVMVTARFLITRKRFIVAFVDLFFDIVFLILSIVGVLHAGQDTIPAKQALTIFFPIASASYISNQILGTLMQRNFDIKNYSERSTRVLRSESKILAPTSLRSTVSKVTFSFRVIHYWVHFLRHRANKDSGGCMH